MFCTNADSLYKSDSLYSVFTQVIRFHYYRTHKLLEKIGIYPGQPPLLFIIGKQNGQSQRELADKLRIKAATITVMLKRMARSGLIERRPDPKDQRVSRVYLTENGKRLRAEALETIKTIEEECFRSFTAEEQLILRKLLIQMRDNLKAACDENTAGNT